MRCPICKKSIKDPSPGEPPGVFPFCSERCKLIDLGRWLTYAYQIPIKDPDEDHPDPSPYTDPDSGSRPRES